MRASSEARPHLRNIGCGYNQQAGMPLMASHPARCSGEQHCGSHRLSLARSHKGIHCCKALRCPSPCADRKCSRSLTIARTAGLSEL